MSDKILIAYATKWGTTGSIAKEIAGVFREGGVACDVRPAHEVESIEGYRAVVLGSPVYHGHLLGPAETFRQRHGAALAKVPRALFIVSLTMARPSKPAVEKLIQRTRRFVEEFRPADVGLFAGALDYANLGFFTRTLMKLMHIPQGDFRKSEIVRKWAKDVLPRLTPPTVSPPSLPS